MIVTYADWARFMNEGVEPPLPDYIIEPWRLYRRSGIDLESHLLPRLSSEEFRERTDKVRLFLERLDEIITRTKLAFEGFVHYFDKDCYQLYSRVLNQSIYESLGARLVGCRLSEDLVGNGINNLAIRLKRPVSLCRYEHIAPIMHDYIGYAEPIMLNGVLVGSLGVYVKERSRIEEALLLTSTATRLLVESCLLPGRKPKKRSGSHHGYQARYSFDDLSYISASMQEVIGRAQLVSQSDYPVLIDGESGTGKEYLAHAIHSSSPRRQGPFVAVNCASLSHSLVESELFGYADGAFTGAVKGGHRGRIEQADGGTLFLDEVGDLPPGAQAMLLRTLQDHELSRIGDERVIPLDIRVICATNKDLRQLCIEKVFRWDLYYRLAGVTLSIPPLRDRPEDIPVLAGHLLRETNQEQGRERRFSAAAVQLLQKYSWPGNIRELRNIVRMSHLLSRDDEIGPKTIADLMQIQDFEHECLRIKHNTRMTRKERFMRALEQSEGNVAAAARQCGISRATGYRWLK